MQMSTDSTMSMQSALAFILWLIVGFYFNVPNSFNAVCSMSESHFMGSMSMWENGLYFMMELTLVKKSIFIIFSLHLSGEVITIKKLGLVILRIPVLDPAHCIRLRENILVTQI
jgi:hypothetical protein